MRYQSITLVEEQFELELVPSCGHRACSSNKGGDSWSGGGITVGNNGGGITVITCGNNGDGGKEEIIRFNPFKPISYISFPS